MKCHRFSNSDLRVEGLNPDRFTSIALPGLSPIANEVQGDGLQGHQNSPSLKTALASPISSSRNSVLEHGRLMAKSKSGSQIPSTWLYLVTPTRRLISDWDG